MEKTVRELTDNELRTCYIQYRNKQYGQEPLTSIHKNYDGMMATVNMQLDLLSEIAKRYCSEQYRS